MYLQVKDGWGMPPVSRETNLTPMGQDLWGLSRPAHKQQPPTPTGWPAATNGWSNGTNNPPALNNGSAWLLLRNLTAQIDGSTLRTLCMQHGPLNNFHLYLTHGIALAKYSNGSEAKKVRLLRVFRFHNKCSSYGILRRLNKRVRCEIKMHIFTVLVPVPNLRARYLLRI